MHPQLQTLLSQRLEVIADRDFYAREPAAHLEALKDVSGKILAYNDAHHAEFDGKLRHFLSNCSYQKALEHLQQSK